MRILLKKRKYSLVWALLLACLVGTSQAMAKDRYEVFTTVPLKWTNRSLN